MSGILQNFSGSGSVTNSTQYYYDETTGYTNTAASVASPDVILRQNSGDPLGFTIPTATTARTVYVEMFGMVAQPTEGQGAFFHFWPVLTISPGNTVVEGVHSFELLNGTQQQPEAAPGKWKFTLAANESAVVSFRWGTLFGSIGPAVNPDDSDYPCRWQVSATVVF